MRLPHRRGQLQPLLLGAVALLATMGSLAAAAQEYPYKPIRFLVGFTPGTATDIVARVVAAKLSDAWGKQVVVENREGAAGTISAAIAAQANPDGYTLYMAATTFVISPMFIKVSYDVHKDFAPVILLVTVPTVLVVSQSGPGSVKDLIALAKAKPAQLNYASTGKGTASHVAAELLRSMAGIDIVEVPYKSASVAQNGVVNGEVSLYYPNLAAALPLIRAGRLKALAVTGAARSRAAPDIPTMAETLPGYDAANWYGIVVPAKTPRQVIARLNAEAGKILQMPEVQERLLDLGMDVVGAPPQVLAQKMKAEGEKWRGLLKPGIAQ